MSNTKGSFLQVRLASIYSDVVDGVVTLSEFNKKLFNLQCCYKDLAYNITNKWRYGIFCPEDSETLIELRALLRILISYGKEKVGIEAGDTTPIPQAYQDFIDFGGTDLNLLNFGEGFTGDTVPVLPAPVSVGDYFLISDPNTLQYYILQVTSGTYTEDDPIFIDVLLFGIVTEGFSVYQLQGLTIEVVGTGNQEDLNDALIAQAGVPIYASGLTDAEIITIVNRIEKLLKC